MSRLSEILATGVNYVPGNAGCSEHRIPTPTFECPICSDDALYAEWEDLQGLDPNRRRLLLTPASEIKPRRVDWLWRERIPVGELALTPGRAGLGKSTFHAWLIAQITRGALVGIYEGRPRSAIIAASEDSWARTIVPRLIAARADLDRVFRVDVIAGGSGVTRLVLPADVALLVDQIEANEVALVSLDPLLSVLSGTIDSHKNAEVRSALEPLARLADTTGAVVLGNAHFSKGSGTDPLSMITGSAAFGEVARAALAFAQDPDDQIRVVSQIKNNLGRLDLPSLGYEIQGQPIETVDGPTEVGKLVWTGETDRNVRDMLAGSNGENGDGRDSAESWLERLLEAGPITSVEVYQAADAAGYSKDQAKRAKKKINADAIHPDIKGPWYWTLGPREHQEGQESGEPSPTPLHPLSAPLDDQPEQEPLDDWAGRLYDQER